AESVGEHLVELPAEGFTGLGRRSVAQANADHLGLTGTNQTSVMRGAFGPPLRRVHRVLLARDNEVIDAVFGVSALVPSAEEPLVIGLVFGKEQRHVPLARKAELAERGVRRGRAAGPARSIRLAKTRLLCRSIGRRDPLGPIIPEPQGGQQVQFGSVGT